MRPAGGGWWLKWAFLLYCWLHTFWSCISLSGHCTVPRATTTLASLALSRAWSHTVRRSASKSPLYIQHKLLRDFHFFMGCDGRNNFGVKHWNVPFKRHISVTLSWGSAALCWTFDLVQSQHQTLAAAESTKLQLRTQAVILSVSPLLLTTIPTTVTFAVKAERSSGMQSPTRHAVTLTSHNLSIISQFWFLQTHMDVTDMHPLM